MATLKRQRNPTKPLLVLSFVTSTQPPKRTFVRHSGTDHGLSSEFWIWL